MIDFDEAFFGKPEKQADNTRNPKNDEGSKKQSQTGSRDAADKLKSTAGDKERKIVIDAVVNSLETKPEFLIRKEYEEKVQRDKAAQQKKQEETSKRDKEQREIQHQLEKLEGKTSPLTKWSGRSNTTGGKRGRLGFKGKGSNKEKFMSDKEVFESKGNYIKQNYKKGYVERVSSKAGYLKSRFLPNGRSKSFYRKVDPNEDDLQTNQDKYEPDLAEQIETEGMSEAQKKEHIHKMNRTDVTLLAQEETSIITRDNILMKLMNDGFKLLLLDRSNIPESQLEKYLERISSIGACAKIENEADPEMKQNEYKRILKDNFGYEDFYDFQRELILKLDNGENCMADFYTGAGKSLLFQFHSVVHEGITIVIVPLLSLMIDQVKKIPGNIPAICYNSWISYSDRAKILRQLKEKKIKVMFITSELFISEIVWYLLVYEVRINLLAIDEAHCASVFSNNFRPSYAMLEDYLALLRKREFYHPLKECFQEKENALTTRELSELKELDQMLEEKKPTLEVQDAEGMIAKSSIPGQDKLPILCLTATSSQETKASVLAQFRIPRSNYLSSNYYIRDNLFVTVSKESKRVKDILFLLNLKKIKSMKPLLIYCNFKKVVGVVEMYLKQSGVNSKPYSSDLTELERMNILQQFLRTDPLYKKKPADELFDFHQKIEAIVTTVSLAMGIDHRSIRGVVHYNMPGSLETYIQEIGRAGRDSKPAFCHTFLVDDDYFFQRSKCLVDNFYDRGTLKKLIYFVLGLNADRYKKKFARARKVNGLNFEDMDRSEMPYAFIKNDSIKSKLKMKYKDELVKMLHVLRELLREEYQFNFEYAFDVNSSAVIKILRSTDLRQFHANSILKLITKNSRKKDTSYHFSTIHIANLLRVRPQYLMVCIKELAQKLQFSFSSLDYSVVFTNMQYKLHKSLTATIRVDTLVDRLYKRNVSLIRTFCTKVDSFYCLMRSQAKKPIRDFVDTDLEEHSSQKMEKYVRMYFERDSSYMINAMKHDGLIKHLPVIRIIPKNKMTGDTEIELETTTDAELKEIVGQFFGEHASVGEGHLVLEAADG